MHNGQLREYYYPEGTQVLLRLLLRARKLSLVRGLSYIRSVLSKTLSRAPSGLVVALAACVVTLVVILIPNLGKHPKNTVSRATSAPVTSVLPISKPASIPVPPRSVQQRSKAPWLAMLKGIFLSVVDYRSSALEPSLDGVSVWTDRRSGFYYCADSPYFEKVQPGSLVRQANALQSGYQPKLGSYCRK